jgi:tetratricopeptide (TPR) repeat protein
MRSWMLGLALVLATTPALADDKAKAKALYDEGLRHYQVAEYAQAIDAWKQSYLMSKKPLLLFNIGQAYRLSGDCKQAMTFYDNYQDAEPNPKNQDELDQAIAACKAQGDKPATNPSTTKPDELDEPGRHDDDHDHDGREPDRDQAGRDQAGRDQAGRDEAGGDPARRASAGTAGCVGRRAQKARDRAGDRRRRPRGRRDLLRARRQVEVG